MRDDDLLKIIFLFLQNKIKTIYTLLFSDYAYDIIMNMLHRLL